MNAPGPWTTVLFDFDGTLADTIPLIVASYRYTLARAGLPEVPDEQVRSWIGRPLEPVLEERYPGRGAELTAIYRAWNLSHHDELILAVPGMADALADLSRHGIRMGVVSSKATATVRLGLRAVGLDHLIDVLAGLDDTDRHKPDPAPLVCAATRLGVAPGECAYVGDADVDVLAARAAGMAAIGVTWGAAGPGLASSFPDALVADAPALSSELRVGGGVREDDVRPGEATV
ncbi:MAG: HAD-IA family hydrolase [Nostocoides sp.]